MPGEGRVKDPSPTIVQWFVLVDVELLLVQGGVALHDHRLLGEFFHLDERAAVVGFEGFGDLGIHAQHYVRVLQVLGHFAHLEVNVIADRGHGLYEAGRSPARPSASR